ncbi:MAG: alpha/beta fold hydrolase [Verrucomicrobiota bacterium]
MKTIVKLLPFLLMTASLQAKESVVLLHGLSRTSASMKKIEKALTQEGYVVHNINYPSRSGTIEALAAEIRSRILKLTSDDTKVHFVTHSMGGIIVRQIQKAEPIENIGRAVMLSPPNHGSEVVDKLDEIWLLNKFKVPARSQLGTKAGGFVKSLGPVDFEVGVLTGDRSINWILSTMIPGKDDGKVSLESAKVEGMKDYKVIHASHPFIMRKKGAIKETISFLKTGSFLDH